MSNWTSEKQPFGPNHAPLLEGLSSIDGETPVPVAVVPSTGAVLTSAGAGLGSLVGIDPIGQYGVAYDTITYTATSGTVDTYTYKTGGVSGTTTATVTITYTDSTHATLVSVVRT